MEIFKPKLRIGSLLAWLAGMWLAIPLTAGEPLSGAGAAADEASRRGAAVEEARMLLEKGDQAYQAGRYQEAVEAYAGARELIPDAPVTAELRMAATERYAQASVEHARVLSKKGDVAAARAAVDKVLRENVAPNDPGALAFRAQLDDPIRTNPALTAEHARDIDEVRRHLYTAEGAYNLGKFDQAKTEYENVLRIDPANQAARRGMERLAGARSAYSQAAYDHTRAELLSQVDAAWEIPISAPELGAGPEDPGGAPASFFSEATVATRIKRMMVPRIALDQASLEEAVDFLRLVKDTDGSTVNFTINLGQQDSELARSIRERKFNLQLSQVPLAKVLKYICDITQTNFTTDEFSVIITPAGSTSDELIYRNYRVPPDFLANIGSAAGAAQEAEDPFAETPAGGGLLTRRLSAQEALAAQGVSFPEGASASYNAATNTLRVLNTAANQDIISQIVETISQTEPVTVSVKVTMIKTQKSNLDELGFDWLLTPMSLGGGEEVFAAGGTTGNTSGRNATDFAQTVTLPSDPTATVNPGVVTNGLRSGNQATNTNSIDGLIANPDRDSQSTSVAPGILSLTGLFNDGQVQMMLRGLDQKKNVDIMIRPTILTRSGQSSSVVVSREFIYPTEYEPPELPNSTGLNNTGSFPVTPATPTAFEKRDVGVVLEVLPVADSNKRYIDITLNPSVTDFDGFVNYGSPITSAVSGLFGPETVTITENRILMPVFSTQRANTQLTVADGSTIAIGGLMADSIQNVEDKVPILGDIPWVGRLFQSKSSQNVSTAIIFLVHVELLDPTGRPYRDR